MINSVIKLIANDYAYVRKHPQIIMTILLIVVIPAAFLFSGQQFLSAAKDNQERLEKDRIGILHDVLASVLTMTNFDTSHIQDEIVRIARQNSDITQFVIATERGNQIIVVASLDVVTLDSPVPEQNEFRIANVHPDESIILPFVADGIRYWRSYRLVTSGSGVDYYIFTETSLAHIDSIFASRIIDAYYWLFGVLAVVLILVLRHVRLIDYSYLYRETKRANEMKDMFINMIAHELRAPLTAMRGYASMIRETVGVHDEIKNYSQKIEDAAERLVLVVNDLLDVARIHSGKLSMSPARTDIQSIITSVIEIMQSSAHEKGIVLSENAAPHSLFINADEKRLHQALINLVSNSIKYTESGSITVSLDERDDRVEIRVKDTGMGIDAENQKKLFAPFFRVEGAKIEGTVGTGLGMWITKQLIELMKGSIAVESIKGIGTHVIVTLPKT